MLYGRDGELARVDAVVAAARAGRSGTLVLRGEAGIGKSALLAHAVDSSTGMRVLRCTGVETESELPFAGVHRLLRPVLHLAEALAEPQRAAVHSAFGDGPVVRADRWLLSLAVLNLLSEAAIAQPVLCVVDDAQWLDTGSSEALTFVARRVDAEGIALLFAARDDPHRTFDAEGLPTLRVTGLDAAGADGLLAAHATARVAPEVRDRILEGTLGNPLALRHLLDSLDAAQLAGSTPLPQRLPVGADVERLFGERVQRQPEATRTLLLIAAANDSDDIETVIRAAELLGAGPDALDAAESAELLTVHAGTVRFRHPLVRSATYRGATPAARRAAERALADTMSGDSNADRRAWHRANATLGTDDAVCDDLEAAGARARDRAGYAAATAAFERAATFCSDVDRRARLLTDAGEEAWLAGRPQQARDLLARANPASDDVLLRGRADHLRGSIEAACGAPVAAYATLMTGATALHDADPARACLMLAEAGQIAWGTGDLDRITTVGQRLSALPGTGNPGARTIVGLTRYMQGDTEAAARELRAAADLARDFDQPQMVMLAAAGAMFSGDDGRAIDLFSRAVARTRSAGAAATLPVLLAPLATIEMFTGRYMSARTTASEALRLAVETSAANPAAHARSVLAWLAAVTGSPDECSSLANEALSHAIGQRLGPHAAIATWALAHNDLAAGRADDAAGRLVALAAAAPGEGNQMVSMFAAADLVDAATRTGRISDAEAAAQSLAAWTATTGAIWAQALVARCHAQLASDADCDDLYLQALDLHARGGRPFDTARTALCFGERLRRRRRRADARTYLRAALEVFERLGATPWAEHTRSELLATGETARKRDVSTASALTPQELQIARLVAAGATNKAVAAQLFLSPRTVDYHLRKVFTKLGLASRHELVRLSLRDDDFRIGIVVE